MKHTNKVRARQVLGLGPKLVVIRPCLNGPGLVGPSRIRKCGVDPWSVKKTRFHPSLPSSVPSQALTPKSPRSPLMAAAAAAADADAAEVERLYELGERLSSAKDKSEVPPRSPIFC